MYVRKRHGLGFTYQYASGKTIRDKNLRKWIKSLAIPPAWQDVEISNSKKSKVLVTGRDAKGRKQYIYSESYQKARAEEKFNRIIRFAEKLETMRRVTGQHLRSEKITKKKVCATMVRLMDQAYFRPGNKQYSKRNNTYGLTTMRSKHINFEGDTIFFNYIGKSGKEQHKEVTDERLAQIIRELDELPGYRVFKYFDEVGEKHTIESNDLNAYIHKIMGENFSAKDFRTWAGTVVAAIALDQFDAVEKTNQDQLNKNIKEAINVTAEMLGNTPAVARSSYIDPRVIYNYINGQTVSFFSDQAEILLEKGKNLQKEERLVLCMLKNST